MKIIRWLTGWGSLYLLAGIFLAALFWVQNLNIKPGDNELLSIGLLIGFGFVLNSWIDQHESDLIDSKKEEFRVDLEDVDCQEISSNHAERLN